MPTSCERSDRLIREAFSNIPADDILQIARDVRAQCKDVFGFAQIKKNQELVTVADIRIQQRIIDYFASTGLKDCYYIKAEEELVPTYNDSNLSLKQYQLLIDPLDGTTAFVDGLDQWGTMVGLCDSSGCLQYSWNLLSDGTVYSSMEEPLVRVKEWDTKPLSDEQLIFDVYDYNAGSAQRFTDVFVQTFGNLISSESVQVNSSGSAVWAGYKLYTEELDGLIWLPSTKGKCVYPDYDLIFLGALQKKGWQIALNIDRHQVQAVIVAPTKEAAEVLKQVAEQIAPIKSICWKHTLHIASAL